MKLPVIMMFALCLGAEEWKFSPGEGNLIRLEVAKTGVLKGKSHVFEFPAFSATADPAVQSFAITLESQKIQAKDDWVKPNDLKKIMEFTLKDMLDATKYPTIRFQSSIVTKTGNSYKAIGALTIRDKTENVVVNVTEKTPGNFEGNAEVDMRRFGLKPASAMLGAIGTDPIMQLRFQLRKR